MGGNARAGDVHMRAPAILLREGQHGLLDRFALGIGALRHAHPVIMVHQRDRALAGGNRLDLAGIAALRRPREIRHDAARPGFRRILAQPVDQFAHQGEIVDIRAGAHADFALEIRAGEVGILIHLFRLHTGRIIDNHAQPFGQTIPIMVGIAEMFGNALQQDVRLDGLHQAGRLEPVECASIGRNDDVRGAFVALGLHRFEQFGGAGLTEPDLDSGLGLEAFVEFLVRIVVPRRIYIQHAGWLCRRCSRSFRLPRSPRRASTGRKENAGGGQGHIPFHGTNSLSGALISCSITVENGSQQTRCATFLPDFCTDPQKGRQSA